MLRSILQLVLKKPWRNVPLKRWPILHTAQIWHQVTFTFLKSKSGGWFRAFFDELVLHWKKCLANEGSYIEKWRLYFFLYLFVRLFSLVVNFFVQNDDFLFKRNTYWTNLVSMLTRVQLNTSLNIEQWLKWRSFSFNFELRNFEPESFEFKFEFLHS